MTDEYLQKIMDGVSPRSSEESPAEYAARIADEALSAPTVAATEADGDQPAQDQLRLLGSLVVEMTKLELRSVELQMELDKVKKELRVYETKTVPNMMLDLGLESIRMQGSGAEVRVETQIYSGLSKDQAKRREAYAWLAKTGNDELIKRDVTVSFDRESTAEAERLMTVLGEQGFDKRAEVTYEWTIHNQTLGKFVRDVLAHERALKEDGTEPENPIPRQAFGIFEEKVAVVHRQKARR